MPTTYVLTLLVPGKFWTILLLLIQPATSSGKSMSQVFAGVCRTPGFVISGPAPPMAVGSRKSSPSCSPVLVADGPLPVVTFIASALHWFAAWQGPTPAAVQYGLPRSPRPSEKRTTNGCPQGLFAQGPPLESSPTAPGFQITPFPVK